MKKTIKERAEEFIWNGSRKVKMWWDENKEWAVVVVPAASMVAAPIIRKGIGGGIGLVKDAMNFRAQNLRVYDNHNGTYLKLKRELSNSDWVTINHRRANGEYLVDILNSMRVLK